MRSTIIQINAPLVPHESNFVVIDLKSFFACESVKQRKNVLEKHTIIIFFFFFLGGGVILLSIFYSYKTYYSW